MLLEKSLFFKDLKSFQIKIICASIQQLEHQCGMTESQGDAYCPVTAAFVAVISGFGNRIAVNGRVFAS